MLSLLSSMLLLHLPFQTAAFQPHSQARGRPRRSILSGASDAIVSVVDDGTSISAAAALMVQAFWLPQVAADKDVGTTTMDALTEEQSIDLDGRYGERMGARLFPSGLLLARLDDFGETPVGMVGIEAALWDRSERKVLSNGQSESMLKDALSSVGPKQRRALKGASLQALCSELLSGSSLEPALVLANLAVLPSARRRGVANSLCRAAEGYALEKIVPDAGDWEAPGPLCVLQVEGANGGARALYESAMGFGLEWTDQDVSVLRADLDTASFIEVEGAELVTMSKALLKAKSGAI